MAIFKGRVRVRYGYSRWGYTRNNGKGWHGGSDEEGLDSTTIRMPDYKGKSISGRVITARKVDRSTGSKTWEWGWYVCVELDAGQTPDAVNCLYFCHNARNLVSVGQRVKSGDALAVMGSTGNASLASPPFAHCHFEVRATAAGAGLDPTAYTGHPNAVGTYGEAIGETEDSDMKFLEVTSGKCEVFTAPDVNAVDKHYNGGNDSTANHYAALLAQVQAAQDAAARRAEELARQKQQAAQAAYDKNMGWTSFPRGDTVLLPGSPAKLPHTFFEDPMACAPYSVNLMGARTRRHASAMDAVPHPLPSVMFPTVPGLSGVMPAKEIPLSDIVVWYTCPAVFPMGP